MHLVRLVRSRPIPRIVAMLAAAGALAAGVAACGYKGPLYMPGSPQDVHRRQPPPALKPGETPSEAATPDTAAPAPQPDTAGDAAKRTNPVPNLFQ
ncbi:MAG TPA: lipoprotein [Bordetella sp.]